MLAYSFAYDRGKLARTAGVPLSEAVSDEEVRPDQTAVFLEGTVSKQEESRGGEARLPEHKIAPLESAADRHPILLPSPAPDAPAAMAGLGSSHARIHPDFPTAQRQFVDRELYHDADPNPVKQVSDEPVSTVSIDADTAAYALSLIHI